MHFSPELSATEVPPYRDADPGSLEQYLSTAVTYYSYGQYDEAIQALLGYPIMKTVSAS
ncbi:MAG: hypothetical protein IPL56_14615 [Saprospiraceae bacterium]|nr:hypothetical protein [Saprospiraceae bacterium]